MLKNTFTGLQRVYLHSFSCCCLPNLRNTLKIRAYSTSRSSKDIDLYVLIESALFNFVLVINSNFGRISYRFRDIDAFRSKIAWFPHPHPCVTPTGEGTACDINVTCASLKSTSHNTRLSLFLAVVGSQICEISRNSERIRTKVIHLGGNRKSMFDFQHIPIIY